MLKQNIVVANLKALKALKNHTDGELAYIEDTKEIYSWSDEKNEWIKVEANGQGIELNLYDLNKSIIGQLESMTPDEISAKAELFNTYCEDTKNTFHMLLCRDCNYYTIFSFSVKPEFSDFASAVSTIITELGDVYSIERLENGAIEIWIKPAGEETPCAFYLFPYDAGVVYYG